MNIKLSQFRAGMLSAAFLCLATFSSSFIGCSSSTTPPPPSASKYGITVLTADAAGLGASQIDAKLVNAWGASNANGLWWIADNGSGYVTVYNSSGAPTGVVLQVPGQDTTNHAVQGKPTSIVSNPSSTNFFASQFVIAGEEGTINTYASGLPNALQRNNQNSHGAVYKGMAIASNHIYAANFGGTGYIDVFDSNISFRNNTGLPGNLRSGFAPFNIVNLNNTIYVTYAKQKAGTTDDQSGVGNGYIGTLNTTSNTLDPVWADTATLNSPWGMTIAPSSFGDYSGKLLIGNFGDGTISAYDTGSKNYVGQLKDASGNPIKIDGLWSLSTVAGDNAVYYTAGPSSESHGTFGKIVVQ